MKLKEKVEKEGMNKELYDLFIDIVKLEYNKASFLIGAKLYCWMHGLDNYTQFFADMYKRCSYCKEELIVYLLKRFEIIPTIEVDAIETDYDSAEKVFIKFAELEDKFIEKLDACALKAKDADDVSAMAFLFPQVNQVNHIACRALEAVRNNENPRELIHEICAYNVSCSGSY